MSFTLTVGMSIILNVGINITVTIKMGIPLNVSMSIIIKCWYVFVGIFFSNFNSLRAVNLRVSTAKGSLMCATCTRVYRPYLSELIALVRED